MPADLPRAGGALGDTCTVTFDAAAVQHAYESIAVRYETTFADDLEVNEFDRAIVDAALSAVPRDAVVLDVGCGPGQVSQRALAAGAAAVGIDLTPAMLAVARRRAPTVPLTCGNLLALPYRPDSAAAIIAWFSLHNLPRRLMPSALMEIRRVLRLGGVAVIATHGGKGEEVIQQTSGDRSEIVTITYYGGDELFALAAAHGFTPAELRERPPLDHEHQVPKLYLSAHAT